MKTNVSYYRRDARSYDQWQFKQLRKKYGWAGEAKFWALLDIVAFEDNCSLNTADEQQLMCICTDLDFTTEEFFEFIQYLSDKLKLLVLEDGTVTSPAVQDCLAEVTETRMYHRKYRRAERKKTLPGDDVQQHNNTKSAHDGFYNMPDTPIVTGDDMLNLTAATPAENAGMLTVTTPVLNLTGDNNSNSTAMLNLTTPELNLTTPDVKLNIEQIKEIKENKRKYMYETRVARADTHTHSLDEQEKFREFTDWVRNKAPCVALMKDPFTMDEYLDLERKHKLTADEVKHLLIAMHNYPKLNENNRSAYLTLLKFNNLKYRR